MWSQIVLSAEGCSTCEVAPRQLWATAIGVFSWGFFFWSHNLRRRLIRTWMVQDHAHLQSVACSGNIVLGIRTPIRLAFCVRVYNGLEIGGRRL